MGAVAMQSRYIGNDGGYPINEATLYIYCDACGSFNIKTYIPFIKSLTIVVALIVAGCVIVGSDDREWWVCLIPIGLVAMFLPWRDILLRYKCRKCGNTHITFHNALHYQAYDRQMVDTPDPQKRYIDDGDPQFHQFM